MVKGESKRWDSVRFDDSSRAWFVTRWNGRIVGAAPEFELLFVVEIPRSSCLCLKLFGKSFKGWEIQALRDLASVISPPDFLVTDDTSLQSTLVSTAASFRNPVAAYLHKPITAMPAIQKCIDSVTELMHQPFFQARSTVEEINEQLEHWRAFYNN
ncbi:hypothetical protein [Paraburkholderia metrosideri]|uniref:hypothetical protein n=1 Tax=Paraburkholderia metrosideri TaxID=580937 RepID=UPI001918C3B1|nr:hypothetical protein [Paraburkholderia metrosideri]